MPATRSRQSKTKRRRISSEDGGGTPEKRHRSGGDTPVYDDSISNDVVHLRDRARFSWQTKGKWKERTPKRAPMSLSQAASDLFGPNTSTPGASGSGMQAAMRVDTWAASVASTVKNSSPVSPKDVPVPETPIISQKELELQAEIERLRNALVQKDQVISRHENTIEVVQNSMHCPICLDPLWKPFVVVPCGHIACQSCLINWFTSPPPDPNGNQTAPLPPHRQKKKRKTCPHCRGVVRSRPVEVFGLGAVVTTVVGQPAPPSTSKAGPLTPPGDPWADMFSPPSGNPLRDEEDGVLRCPSCLNEIWDGECTNCGRMFSDNGSGDSAFGSDDGSISIYGDGLGSIYGGGGSLYGGSMFGGEGSEAGSANSVYEGQPPLHMAYMPRVYDSYDEDEDEDDSFVDDSELPRPPPPAAYFRHYVPSDSEEEEEEEEEEDGGYHSARGYRSPVPVATRISDSDSAEDDGDEDSSLDEDDEEDDFLPGRGRRGRSAETQATAPETAEEADDEDEDEDDNGVNPDATIDLVSDDDDEPPVRPTGRRMAAARWGWSPQDGEPPRGRSLARRRILSPEAGSEDGSEYFSD